MNWDTLRERVAAVVAAADGIGKVHLRKRSSKFLVDWFEHHASEGIVNSWEVTREGFITDHAAVGDAIGYEPIWHTHHGVLVIGRMSVKDSDDDEEASETKFNDLVDEVGNQFRDDPLLNLGEPNDPFLVVPLHPVTGEISEVMFGKILCHEVRITFEAVERTVGNEL